MLRRFLFWGLWALPAGAALGQIQAPAAYFPAWTQRFTPHHEALSYLHALDAATARMQVRSYGTTWEGRPLEYFVIASERNMARIDRIQAANRARFRGEVPEADVADIALVWLSYGVHGNEAACTEAALEVAHSLVAGGKEVDGWLDRVVVILDPCLNPDGHEKYARWYTEVAGVTPDVLGSTAEHDEPWPGGRLNHYLFDLNRDWAWLTQPESRARRLAYAAWMPHVHCDFHEMGGESPYYFPPAAEPYHAAISPWQRAFQDEIGRTTARAFDARGERYFTRETFDLFYPSYGDTYPTYLGAIGMTYEQGGSYGAGLALELENGTVLTLADRVENHVVASLAAVETAARLSGKLVDEFARASASNLKDPWGPYAGYVLPAAENDRASLDGLAAFLAQHGFSSYRYSGAAPKKPWAAWSYDDAAAAQVVPADGDLFVPAAQPGATLLQVLFDPAPVVSDSVTYDITAWSLPYAWDLRAFAVTSDVGRAGWPEWTPAPPATVESGIGWAVRPDGMASSRFLAGALAAGLPVRVADKPFTSGNTAFPRGTLVVLASDAPDREVQRELAEVVRSAGVSGVVALGSGRSESGVDLGSDALRWIPAPSIALAWGPDVSPLAAGAAWWHLEHELKYPVHRVNTSDLCRGGWDAFDVVLLPSGRYRALRGDCTDELAGWIERGGRLVAWGSALGLLEGSEAFGLSTYGDEEEEKTAASREEERAKEDQLAAYADADRRAVRSGVEGALFRTEVDSTHPLAYGFSDTYTTLKTSSDRYALLSEGNVFRIAENARPLAGFAGSRAVVDLQQSLVFGAEPLGSGVAVYLVDDPLFRGFWEASKPVFSNALFLVR